MYTPTPWKDRAVEFPRRYTIPGLGGKNLIPPFGEGWTLHENTRMRQANFAGKVAGSTVANPHLMKGIDQSLSLAVPSSGAWSEFSTASYTAVATLDGSTARWSTATVNGSICQQLISFNLVEHVIRNHGVGVFGSATTVADRVAWLKVNVTKLTGNWHGFGSGPSGNKANFTFWNSSSSFWNAATSNTSSAVAKLNYSSTAIDARVDANGFVHFLAYADASNGTIASTINTDFVELEVYMKEGSVPVADYDLTLNATAAWQASSVTVNGIEPNKVYTLSRKEISGNMYWRQLDSTGATIQSQTVSGLSTAITTLPNTVAITVLWDNVSVTSGVFKLSEPQLELGSVKTAFEPMKRYEIIQAPGFVTQVGTPVNAANLLKLETGLETAAATADSALSTANAAFPKAGGTVTGPITIERSDTAIILSPLDSGNVGKKFKITNFGGKFEIQRLNSSDGYVGTPFYINHSDGTVYVEGGRVYNENFKPFVSGTYTGNGVATRDIALPFTPSAVIITTKQGGMQASGSVEGGLAVTSSAITDGATATLIAVGVNKFTVATHSNGTGGTNLTGKVYNYIAFR